MDLMASVGRAQRSKCLTKDCHNLTLKATCLEERKLLSALYRVLVNGGRIEVTASGSTAPEFIYEIPTH